MHLPRAYVSGLLAEAHAVGWRLRRALEVAREHDARMWELRAAASLARLWAEQGTRAEAYDLLAPVYGWFTEGFDAAALDPRRPGLDHGPQLGEEVGMARTRVGLVGLGMAVAPHARSLVDLADRVEVAWAFSRSEAKRRAFAEQYSFPLTDNLDQIEGDETVRAVLLLTPPNTHLELATRFARAGKHILLEKPIEVSTARAEQLVATCRAAGVTLGIVLQHRFRLGALKLADLLQQGGLGEIASASASIRLWRPQSYYDEPGRGTRARDGGGVLLTQGIHTLDLMLSLAGPAQEVSAFARTSPVHRMETEDLVAGAVRFAGGVVGVIDATTAAYPGFVERIELIGTRGTAVLDGAELTVYWQDGERLRTGGEEVVEGGADPMAFPHDFHRRLIENFLDAIEHGREPRVNGEEALKVHRLIDALLQASAERRVVNMEA